MTAPSPDEQDRQDMAQLAAGRDDALNELMARHAQSVFHFLLRTLQNEEDAADLAQETFVKVYQNRAKFDSQQRFTPWLYAIATNLARDRFRWRSRHPQTSLDAENPETESSLGDTLADSASTPDEVLQAAERAGIVQQAVATLPLELREPLILSFYQNLSHTEIGQILNCTAKAVETRIYRARNRLRERLHGVT